MADKVKQKKRVLVVDDEPKLLKFVEVKLKICGYEVMTTTSGQEALNLAATGHPDVMVLDIVMPEMDGFEVLRNLRTFSKLPVIVFSARAINYDKITSLGASDYLLKPFDPDELVRRIQRLTEGGNGKN